MSSRKMRPFAGFVASKSSNSRPCVYQGTSQVAQQREEQRGDANGDKRDGCAGSDDLRNAFHSILKKLFDKGMLISRESCSAFPI